MNLTEKQKKAISFLAASPLKKKFYWTGGTLLSFYYLRHRRSLDLDFFSEREFSFDEVNGWVQTFKKTTGFKKVRSQKVFARYEFLLSNGEDLRIEFVYYNREKKTLGKRRWALGVMIDSLEDIAANKTMAFLDRNEPKDLFDIYFLLKQKKFTPEKLLELVSQKFGVDFGQALFYSEVFKGLPLLKEIKPLMIEKNETERDELLEKIAAYFKEGSNRFLEKELR